jgi:putative peptide zinc metalloprotease protein
MRTKAGTPSPAAHAAAPPLPRLRDELRIERAAPLADGAPCWTLIDPAAHRYFQLGQREIQLLGLWKLRTREALADTLVQRGAPLQAGELERLQQFLEHNGLVEFESAQTARRLAERRRAGESSGLQWLLHHYLFFRVPLLRPGAFLRRTLPGVRRLWSPPALLLLGLTGLTGGYLVGRQWDSFLNTFADFLSWQGLLSYLVAAVLVKTAHEFGHAYAATHFGCRVPTMGVAVMMGLPMLYSDTTASWRLRRRSSRVLIDAAGVLAELMVAVLATFTWAFLPDGGVRSAVFVLATSSWVMSLVVNLNPFMRFDGYYLLSDALGLPNLQPRAFALARWQLREVLLNLGAAPPEPLPRPLHRLLVAYAWTTWVYRLVLYAGIALAVYHYFFKALGVALFLVEVTWFILRPVGQELQFWWRTRDQVRHSRRAWGSLAGMVGLTVLCALPLDRSVSLPAVLAPTGDTPLHADAPAQIEAVLVQDGASVRRGDVLVRLASPVLAHERTLTLTRMAVAQARLDRIAGAPRELAQTMVLARELQMQQRTLQALDAQQARLTVRAPFDGQVIDLEPDLRPGRWIDRRLEIGRIVSAQGRDLRAYVPETEVWRLQTGRPARFIADDPALGQLPARVVEVGSLAAEQIELVALSSVFGGPIATHDDMSRGLRPVQGQYHVRLRPDTDPPAPMGRHRMQQVTGWIQLDAQPQSLLSMAAAQVLRVLAREADL